MNEEVSIISLISDDSDDSLDVDKSSSIQIADITNFSCADDFFDIDYKKIRSSVIEECCLKESSPICSPTCKKRKTGETNFSDVSICESFEYVSPDALNCTNQKISKKRIPRPRALTEFLKTIEEPTPQKLNDSVLSEVFVISDNECDVDCDVFVRIKWESQSMILKIEKAKTCLAIFDEISRKLDIDSKLIVLSHEDHVIESTTKIAEIANSDGTLLLEGGLLSMTESNNEISAESCSSLPAGDDPDVLLVKVQNANKRGSVELSINKFAKLNELMQKYADIQKSKINELKFYFDGELLSSQVTADSLGMEDGDCVDVYSAKS